MRRPRHARVGADCVRAPDSAAGRTRSGRVLTSRSTVGRRRRRRSARGYRYASTATSTPFRPRACLRGGVSRRRVDGGATRQRTRHPDCRSGDAERSGLSFVRRTRQNSNINRRMPAIALSAFAEMRSEESARGAGFSAFLAKPASPDALIGLIDRLLTTSSTNS